ncbi:cytochrome P450 [Geopyxis carbonaria]|nr:cytochrome P450 [Geopyxis carbonaria]
MNITSPLTRSAENNPLALSLTSFTSNIKLIAVNVNPLVLWPRLAAISNASISLNSYRQIFTNIVFPNLRSMLVISLPAVTSLKSYKLGTSRNVVRFAPNDLSFCTRKSQEDIYGKKTGRKFFLKDEYWDSANMGFKESGILTERNDENARRKRQYLRPLFTLKTLRKYSEIVDIYVSKFLHHLETQGSSPRGVDLKELINWTTFDIIGDLTFGESFGCLDNSRSHKWQSILNDNVNIATFADALRRFPLLNWVVSHMIPKKMMDAQKYHKKYTLAKLQKRIYNPKDPNRIDFMTHLLALASRGHIDSLEETASNVAQIITAGAESPGTALVFTMWYLLKTPHILEKVYNELRENFSSVQDITGDSTAYLPYLNASIKEAFRLHAAGPTGLSRISPGETVDGYYVPVNTILFSHTWSIFRSKTYWSDPNAFKPERWVDKNSTDKKDTLTAFGIGPRSCPASDITWSLMRVIIGRFLYLMDVTLDNPEHDWMSEVKAYLLWSSPPLMVHTKRRVGAEGEKW